MTLLYTAWFRDVSLPPEDPDYEWPACFLIEADSIDAAKAWADGLAQDRKHRGEVFLSSDIREVDLPLGDGLQDLPALRLGDPDASARIGW